jgi:hypothetical protein
MKLPNLKDQLCDNVLPVQGYCAVQGMVIVEYGAVVNDDYKGDTEGTRRQPRFIVTSSITNLRRSQLG